MKGANSPGKAGTTGDTDSIPGWGRAPEGENSNPLQYSCLENPVDRGAWMATVHGDTELDMNERTRMYYYEKT